MKTDKILQEMNDVESSAVQANPKAKKVHASLKVGDKVMMGHTQRKIPGYSLKRPALRGVVVKITPGFVMMDIGDDMTCSASGRNIGKIEHVDDIDNDAIREKFWRELQKEMDDETHS